MDHRSSDLTLMASPPAGPPAGPDPRPPEPAEREPAEREPAEGEPGTDADLVLRSRADPEAFGPLFARHARAVHAFLARRADRQTADELLAEVFTVAFESRHRYRAEYRDARPWLYGIAHNLLRTRARREYRQADALARLPVDASLDAASDWAAVDDRLDARAGAAPALAALRRLPEGEREVVQLVAWEGLDPIEVALVLGIPAGTARSRLHRARRVLRAALERHRPDSAIPGDGDGSPSTHSREV